MRAILSMCLLLSQVTAACYQKDQLPTARSSAGLQQTRKELNPHIPPPDPSKYKDVRDAREWQNPYLVVRAEGVEVIWRSAAVQRRIIPCDEVATFLEALPATAWPYGRVVAAQEIGIRRGDGRDDQPIAENKERVERILGSLGVKVDWWASA
jgi:hypothetical protein